MKERILIVDDEKLIRWSLAEAVAGWGFSPVEASNKREALKRFETESPVVTLLDINLPDGSGLDLLLEIKKRQPEAVIIMITANVMVDDTIAALRGGAFDFIGKPINLEEIHVAIRNGIEIGELRREVNDLRRERFREFSFEHIIGSSPAMLEIKKMAHKVAASTVSSILLQGESGTGKDLFARAIHYASTRSHKLFVAVNCAAIPATLIESELFGYEKGAFTDAKERKEGLFEQAQGGTIFLDEIGELELNLQAKLLRVLEAGEFRRVGGLRDLPLDARVIGASNRDLKIESSEKRFRLDLYYRLSVIQLEIPPLRERGDDIITLAKYFIKHLGRSGGKKHPRKLSQAAEHAFRNYSWKGNVRELKNAIERVLILDDGEEISTEFLPKNLQDEAEFGAAAGSMEIVNFIDFPPAGLPLDQVENILIRKALKQAGGNVTRAGELLQISRDRVRYFLKKNDYQKLNRYQ